MAGKEKKTMIKKITKKTETKKTISDNNIIEKDLGICDRCKKNKADFVFSAEPMLALTHGWGQENICRFCFIKQLKGHIKDCQKQLKEMQSKK